MPTVMANKDTKTSVPLTEEPQKLVQNLVDKKIRNLEKRKSRLQELKDMSTKGQALEPEQQKAIQKLDQVVEMIDLMKDLNKSISEVLTENTKQQKKVMKKEMLEKSIERSQQELERLKTIIQFQDILSRFETNVRQDFANGTNGAIKLSEKELKNLDELYGVITDVSDGKVESTAEKLISLADGKSREAFDGVSFNQLKALLIKIEETKYFSRETPLPTAPIPSTTATTKQTKKADNSMKKLKETDSSITTQTNSNQFTTQLNTEFTPSLIQNQFATGISFMTHDSLVDKDPAVVAVASVPNTYPSYHAYGLQTNESLINNSISDSNNSAINQQKSANFDTSSLSTIPTQTFTNQQFAALIPGTTSAGAVYSPVPVTLTTVPLAGMVAQDLTGQVAADLLGAQTYANQQNFMNSNAPDKHTLPSHERGNNYNTDDNYRNNRMRGNRPDGQKKNMNGSGNRSRNLNKGTGYQNQNPNPNQVFGNFSPKYDNQSNGQTFSNTFGGDKSSNNTWNSGSRGRPQQHRQNRSDNTRGGQQPRTNNNFANNFNTTAAK